MHRNSQIAIALVCVVLGTMVSLQFKVQQAISSNPAYQRSEEVARRLQDAEKERDNLQKEVVGLRAQLAAMAEGKNVITTLTEQLKSAQMLAGLTAVAGPGVTVYMDDSRRPSKPGDDPNAFIIHDDDILSVVNELLASGAEAIAINEQRLMGKTEIRCVGPTISVNGVRIAPPIYIKAIGDPQTIEAGLKTRGGIIDNLGLWGIEVTVKREEHVEIPGFNGSSIFRYAQPQKKGE